MTAGALFKLSTKAEIDALIERRVFKFKLYNPIAYKGIYIFKSQIINKVKGKITSQPYKKSRLVIQGYNNKGKEIILI